MKLKIDSWMGSLGVASASGLLAFGVACSRDSVPVSVPVEERPVVSAAVSLEKQALNAHGSPSSEVHAVAYAPDSASTPAPFSPSYVNFVFGDEVLGEHEHAVRLGVELMHDYSLSLGRPDLDHDVHVYAFDDFESLVDEVYEAWRDVEGNGFSRYSVRVDLFNGDFLGLAASDYAFINASIFDGLHVRDQIRVSAHEFNHAQFNNLGTLGLDDAYARRPDVEPLWLNEGIADFLAYQAISESGVGSYEDVRKDFFPHVLDAMPLERMETRKGFSSEADGFPYSTLAAEFLASHAGQSSLLGFYASLTIGIAWEDQFRETFGMAVNDFYDPLCRAQGEGLPEA